MSRAPTYFVTWEWRLALRGDGRSPGAWHSAVLTGVVPDGSTPEGLERGLCEYFGRTRPLPPRTWRDDTKPLEAGERVYAPMSGWGGEVIERHAYEPDEFQGGQVRVKPTAGGHEWREMTVTHAELDRIDERSHA